MKYFTTPDFIPKTASLPDEVKPKIAEFVAKIEKATGLPDLWQELDNSVARNETSIDNIFVLRISSLYRLFFSVGNDGKEEYILLLDIFNSSGTNYVPALQKKDPRVNGTLNPNINGSINPNINGTLNPNINGSINPNINGSINPNINGTLNPNINGSINPNINGSINPNINGTLNPNINGSINPKINFSFKGKKFYSRELMPQSYMVDANDNVKVIFDWSNTFAGIAVADKKGGFVLFDTQNQWIGYLVSDKKEGYIHFNRANEWVGIVV